MDRLQTMRVFQKVVDEGGFAAAARALDMSPAAVTRLVADLEEHLGTRLLQRTTRRVALTDAGQAYLARVRHILSDVEEAYAAARAHTADLAGVLRIHAPPVLAVHVLAPLVAEFRSRHPQIRLEVAVDAPQEPPVEDFDITLLGSNAGLGAEVIATAIVTSEAVVCASPDYLRRRGVPTVPSDLMRHDCLRLRYPGERPGHWRLQCAEDASRVEEVQVTPVLIANHTDTLLRATLEGAGVSSQPLDLAAPYLKNGQLVRVLRPWITGRFTMYAAFPSRKFMPARTRVFLDFLSEHTRRLVSDALQTVQDTA